MANSNWANEAVGTIDKSSWTSRVPVAHERRETRTVTHERAGVHGATEALLRIASAADVLDDIARDLPRKRASEVYSVQRELHALATEIRLGLGIEVKAF